MKSGYPLRTVSMPTTWEKDAVLAPYQIRRNPISTGPSAFRHGPLMVSLALFIWSLTVFNHSAFRAEQAGCCERNHKKLVPEFDSPFSIRRAIQSTRQVADVHGERDDFPRHRILIPRPTFNLDFSHSMPSLTIFCAPKPYRMDDPSKCEQRRALLSWLRLSPALKVVLLGEDPSFRALQAEFPRFVSVEPNLDFNFRGVPQFHSMIARAEAADTAFSMVINADIILLDDLMPAIQRVASNFDNWLLTASRWDVAEGFPFNFEGTSSRIRDLAASEFDTSVRKYVRANGSLHTYGGVDFWLWNKSPVPLFSGAMPPFTFGRAKYDNWLTHEVVAAGLRDMVDASDAVTSVHVAHSYSHVSVSKGAAAKVDAGKSFWSLRKQSSWEIFSNIHLAQSYGTYRNQMGTALHTPWRLTSCHEPTVLNICLQQRLRPSNCSCEYSSLVAKTQSDPKLDKKSKQWTCGTLSVDKNEDFSIQAVPGVNSKEGLPHTLPQLLPDVSKNVSGLKVVILVAVTMGYSEMLMNFVCQLRKMGLSDHLLVAALDEDLYRFAFTQGLATYYESASTSLKGLNSKDCAFGSQCFRQFTKLKSRAVLRVLREGYSVLWSDVDIVWYKDPLPDLLSYGPGTFPIQSNEPNGSIPGSGIRRINSGFYFARSDNMTIDALAAVVEHASHTKLSEQPSFYDVLCGVKGEKVTKGKEECVYANGLRTVFLDRQVYPNGAVHSFWKEEDVSGACVKRGCAILHNNWISGRDAKKARLVENKFWHYDVERRMCMHNWHAMLAPFVRVGKEGTPQVAEAVVEVSKGKKTAELKGGETQSHGAVQVGKKEEAQKGVGKEILKQR